jgi:hypothetical protein
LPKLRSFVTAACLILTSSGLSLAEPPAPAPAPPNFAFEPVYAPHARPGPTAEMLLLADVETVARYNLGGSSDPAHPSNLPNYHPAPRVVVVVQSVRPRPARQGKRAEQRLQANARRSAYWPIRSCYEPGLRKRQTLGGELTFRATIGAQGSVLATRLLGTDLGDRGVAHCIVRAFRKLKLEHGAGRKIDADFEISVYPGHAPVPDVPVSAATASAKLPVDAKPANALVAGQRAAVAACLAESRKRDPRVWGRLALELTLAEDGSVQGAREVESSFPDPALVACVSQRFAGLRFPAPRSGPSAIVVALRLEPDQPPAPPAPPSEGSGSGSDGAPPSPVPMPGAPPSPPPPVSGHFESESSSSKPLPGGRQ